VIERLAKERQRPFGVLHRVERLDLASAVHQLQPLAPVLPLVQEGCVFLLEVGGVGQHGAAEVGRRGRGVDRIVVAIAHETRQVAAVIDVRVREDHRVDRLRGKRELAVTFEGLFAMALVEPAVEQIPLLVQLELVHRAGDGLSGAAEGETHDPL
jgi:hypothetical protein